MSNNKTLNNKAAVAIYFMIAIAITWGAILLAVGLDGVLGRTEIPETRMPILYTATLLGPTLAGI